MAKLNIAPTKSSLLSLKQQLAFAEEGYDLLEQKRQILIFELMSRLNRARDAEAKIAESFKGAFAALREATLDIGSSAPDGHEDTSPGGEDGIAQHPVRRGRDLASTDDATRRFVEVLPLLVESAELENVVLRLARELRKTQRRCNALSRIFIPVYRETIGYITDALEERERESFIILKMIRNRLT